MKEVSLLVHLTNKGTKKKRKMNDTLINLNEVKLSMNNSSNNDNLYVTTYFS